MSYYSGHFIPTNPKKYVGDINSIKYRSIWERNAMRWCDENPNVEEWSSEEIVVRYQNPVKGGTSQYFPDLFLRMVDGVMRIIEIKPKVQTQPPKPQQRKTKQYINEVATWAINTEKWKAARELAARNNLTFEIWTEDTLTQMGISTTATGAQRMQKAERAKPKLIPIRRKVQRPKRRS